jgi:hypothetical protein
LIKHLGEEFLRKFKFLNFSWLIFWATILQFENKMLRQELLSFDSHSGFKHESMDNFRRGLYSHLGAGAKTSV